MTDDDTNLLKQFDGPVAVGALAFDEKRGEWSNATLKRLRKFCEDKYLESAFGPHQNWKDEQFKGEVLRLTDAGREACGLVVEKVESVAKEVQRGLF